MTQQPSSSSPRKPSLGLSLGVILASAGIIGFSVLKLGSDAHLPLVLAAVLAATCGVLFLRMPWSAIEEGMLQGVSLALQPILILMMVGVMVGVWICSGTVPALIYYGLKLLSPSIFLAASLLICSVVSLATGSSWTTVSSVGIALMGIGAGLGIPAPMCAGAVISGGYFGDKMSPLSDTTNLAPAVAGNELFDHIRAMLWTTGPTYVLVFVIYVFLGLRFQGQMGSLEQIQAIQGAISGHFNLNLLTLLPPLLIVVFAAVRFPAIPGLILGCLAGALVAMGFQGVSVTDLLGVAQNGFESKTGMEMVDDLLSRGGLQGMMWTISLIMCALSFGGIVERCGYLETILGAMRGMLRNPTSLVASTVGASFFGNMFLGDQFLGIVVPGRMFKPAYEEMGLAPRMLSRTLEDCGTLTSPLIPWTACGGFMSSTLGISAFQYAPYAFLNWINPLMAIALTALGIGVFWKGKDGRPTRVRPEKA